MIRLTLFHYLFLFLVPSFFIHTHARSQAISADEAYCFHTTLALCEQLKKQHQPEFNLQLLQKISSDFLKRAGNTYQHKWNIAMADCYARLGDTLQCFTYYFATLKGKEFMGDDLRKPNDPYHFLYQRFQSKFDEYFEVYNSNAKWQNQVTLLKSKLSKMLERDQSRVSNRAQTDSINLAELLPMLLEDTTGLIIYKSFIEFYVLTINLSSHDTTSYQKIINYYNMHCGLYNGFNLWLADHWVVLKYNQSKYYEYLFKDRQTPQLDFKTIDAERKQMGQPSLYFSYVTERLPVPDYYKENPIGPCEHN